MINSRNSMRCAILLTFYFVGVVESQDSPVIPQTEDAIATPAKNEELIRIPIDAFCMKALSLKDSTTNHQIETIHNDMASIAEDIVEMLAEQKELAYSFLKLKGLQKVVVPHLINFHLEMRRQLLLIVQTLFTVAPESTLSAIPTILIDHIVEVFENDPSLGIKRLTVDIMHRWLPRHPKVQARMMKAKGLAPFYRQMPRLDVALTGSLLDLLNKILKEHLELNNSENHVERKLYNKIDLVGKISSPSNCHGLLEFIDGVGDVEDREVILPVLELIKNIKPMCLVHAKGKYKALDVLENLLKYVLSFDKNDLEASKGLNMTEMELILNEFIENAKKSHRDEL